MQALKAVKQSYTPSSELLDLLDKFRGMVNRAVKRYDLSSATEIKENCRQARRGFNRNDHRIMKRLYSKYGRIQKNRVNWILHNTSSS